MPSSQDPRLTEDYVRRIAGAGEDGAVTLIGVVHDHPASAYRAMTVVSDADPDVLALELPPAAVGLFEEYAADGRTPPAFGGEMSAAIRAAPTDRVVGVDGPTPRFLLLLVRTLFRDGASASTTRTVLAGLVSAIRHAAVCRFAGALAGRTGIRLEVDDPVDQDLEWGDDPDEQAVDERSQVRAARAVAKALGSSRATRVRDTARERHMGDRLAALRREGDVVAVVGVGHLDALADRLA